MAQKLIVEGNDAIPLAQLCKLRGLPHPVGYESEWKFKNDFVAPGQGYEKALLVLEEAIRDSNFSNIGMIVDANNAGHSARWQAIRKILSSRLSETVLQEADQQTGPKVSQETGLPKVGIWIMPDNKNEGYLEHFLTRLISPKDPLWDYTEDILDKLRVQPFNEITPAKSGKAQLHTWLAWKKDPGRPFGQALSAGYFDVQSPVADEFIAWFGETFELTK